ncbi:hypothetical protein ACQKCU_14955 [Heyndrickxia sporothermodurans]
MKIGRMEDVKSWIKFSLKNAGVIFIAMLMIIAGVLRGLERFQYLETLKNK